MYTVMGVLTSGTQEAFLSQRSTSLFKPKKQNKETKAKKNPNTCTRTNNQKPKQKGKKLNKRPKGLNGHLSISILVDSSLGMITILSVCLIYSLVKRRFLKK